MIDHPVRLVVTDDLHRSRLTVFFRFFLAIPHLLWLALWGVIVLVVAIVSWFATLFSGRSPQSLHDFLAGYLRYLTHVEAYLYLGANPFPGFFLGSIGPYPIDLDIDPPAPQSRWKTFFRLLLLVPALLLVAAFFGGGGSGGRSGGFSIPAAGVVGTASFLVWFAALGRGRAPRGLRDLIAWGLGYSAQTTAYLLLLTDRYPYTGPEPYLHGLDPPAEAEGRPRLVVADELRRSRLTVFFRLPLALPHVVWLLLWTVLAFAAALLNWLAALAIGRSPRPLTRFLAAYVRYWLHVGAFLSLVGNPFPGFAGKAGSYPIDVEVEPFGAQNRWVTAFRLVLAVPAILVSTALLGLLGTIAILGWFAALVRGEMPQGLRNAGAHALGYSTQLAAYLLVLTDRYAHSSPLAVLRTAGAAPSSGPTLD